MNRSFRGEKPVETPTKPQGSRKNEGPEEPDLESFTISSGNSLLDKYSPTIYLNGEITAETAIKFRSAVKELEFERKTDMALLYITSPGGSVIAAYEILNTMKSSKIEFMTYNASHAMSAAAVIASAGAQGKRFAAPLSAFMVHQISTFIGGHLEEIRNDSRFYESMNKLLMGELCDNCGIEISDLEKRIRDTGYTDLYLSPQEAKKMGLIDDIAWVNLIQAKAYQLEIVTEEPKKPVKLAKKVPTKKKPSPRKVVKKTSKKTE